MTPRELVERACSFYIERFEAFVATQRQAFESGTAELLVEEVREAYQGLCRLDFATPDKALVFVPDQYFSMDIACVPIKSVPLTYVFERLDWQDIVILHDAGLAEPQYVEEWINVWLDPHDVRHEIREPGVVHLLSLEEARMDIDMGTAPASAFWEMMGILEKAGAKTIYVTNSDGAAKLESED